MTSPVEPLSPEVQEANRLYWSSDASVNEVAERLGVSKGALYELLRPYPNGLACPDCGAELGFPNRTARERDRASCPACGLELEGDEPVEAVDRPSAPPGSGGRNLEEAERDRLQLLAGGALIGLAAGILIGSRWGR